MNNYLKLYKGRVTHIFPFRILKKSPSTVQHPFLFIQQSDNGFLPTRPLLLASPIPFHISSPEFCDFKLQSVCVCSLSVTQFSRQVTHMLRLLPSSSCTVLFYFNGGGGSFGSWERVNFTAHHHPPPPSSPSPANNGEGKSGEGVSSFFLFFFLLFLFIYHM